MENEKKIYNPELKAAIEKMQEDNTPENVNHMIDCVMAAQFITPGVVSRPRNVAKNDGKGGTVMQQETQVQFQLIENGSKEKFFPAFTDEEERDKWAGSEGKQNVVMTFDSYAQVLSAPDCDVKGFVINPFGKSVAFPTPMVMSLKKQKEERGEGLSRQEIKSDEKVELADPAPDEYPIDMMAAIISFLNERDDVNKAYLRMFKREHEEKPSYLVIVDFDGDRMEDIFKGISTAAAPHLSGFQLSMMPYNVPFARKAAEDTDPFFEA